MLIDFNEMNEMTIPGMNNGTGTMTAKMFMHDEGKIIPTKILRAVRLEYINRTLVTISTMCCPDRQGNLRWS